MSHGKRLNDTIRVLSAHLISETKDTVKLSNSHRSKMALCVNLEEHDEAEKIT